MCYHFMFVLLRRIQIRIADFNLVNFQKIIAVTTLQTSELNAVSHNARAILVQSSHGSPSRPTFAVWSSFSARETTISSLSFRTILNHPGDSRFVIKLSILQQLFNLYTFSEAKSKFSTKINHYQAKISEKTLKYVWSWCPTKKWSWLPTVQFTTLRLPEQAKSYLELNVMLDILPESRHFEKNLRHRTYLLKCESEKKYLRFEKRPI